MTLKEIRKQNNLTQTQAANYLEISLRTYQSYEKEFRKQKGLRYEYMINTLRDYGYVDEENGLLTIDFIKETCRAILPKYDVSYCFLFGSYAKGKATEKSDVDLMIHTSANGLRFFELAEELREALHKKVDLIDQRQAANNFELVNEVLKDGIKIYG